MVCLSEVFGLDAVLVFLEDFIVAFLLTAGDATMTEFFVADSGLNRDGTAIPYGNAVLFGNVADTRIFLIRRREGRKEKGKSGCRSSQSRQSCR